MWYYEIVTNSHLDKELSPLDKIKINQYEVERQKEIVKHLEEKLKVAKKVLADKIDDTNSIKKDAIKYLDEIKKGD